MKQTIIANAFYYWVLEQLGEQLVPGKVLP
jgi:hypothetical protein